MATQKTDFLKFNAYSMKDLITRKMSEDSKFTDQIYEGSNLAILIDLVAYMYQCLVYQLNNAASESMFSDTQIYENISRLVKMIGYNPRGCKPAQFEVYVERADDPTERDYNPKIILKYSRLDTGLTDSQGKQIYYSVANNTTGTNNITIESEDFHPVNLVNGQYKLYSTVFTSSGIENEVFTLYELASNADEERYIAHDFIDVYIKRNGKFVDDIEFHQDKEEILMGSSIDPQSNVRNNSIYTPTDAVYSIRLNENKTYEIKFGDGITGQKLQRGDQVFIFYLETNGQDGKINLGDLDITTKKFEHSSSLFGLQEEQDYRQIFGIITGTRENLIKDEDYTLTLKTQVTTIPTNEQSVEEIREYAPNWFKTGNRLLTRTDYETFVKSNLKTSTIQVIDVKCMNNWEYLVTFHKWLYNCGRRYHDSGRYYFEENRFLTNGFDYVDAADANNVYLWVKTVENTPVNQIKSYLENKCGMNNIKILTSESHFLIPINVTFDICAAYEDIGYDFASVSKFETFYSNAVNDSYIEITVNENCIYVNSYIKQRIKSIFEKYLSQTNCQIGENINISNILDEIYSITGISRVRTVFQPSNSDVYSDPDIPVRSYAPRALDGISFISFTDSFINYGEDVQIGNVNRHIEDFQFPVFSQDTLDKLEMKIQIIKKQMTNISNIKF